MVEPSRRTSLACIIMGKIGVFDSGMGGLNILQAIRGIMPEYAYCYLGDNARVPYGNRSFETVYQFTRECIYSLLVEDCPLVIMACNTSSAKALRAIQQNDLQRWQSELAPNGPTLKVLGVLRPTTEIAGQLTHSGHLGLLATRGTVESDSYRIEIERFFPQVTLHQQACPLWVPLIEEGRIKGPLTEMAVKECIDTLCNRAPTMDAVILGCTHFPLLTSVIRHHLPPHVQIIEQGPLVAQALQHYLHRHPDIESSLDQSGTCTYLTTEDPLRFNRNASLFIQASINSQQFHLMIPNP